MHQQTMQWMRRRISFTTSCKTVASCSSHDMIVLMGDLNIKVGSNNINREEVMGKFGVKVMNDNGERLCDFCGMNGFVVTGTVFSL